MKKVIAGLAIASVALTHSLAVAAEPTGILERAASPIAEAEELVGGGIWAVIAALAIGIGAIIYVETEEDDAPESP